MGTDGIYAHTFYSDDWANKLANVCGSIDLVVIYYGCACGVMSLNINYLNIAKKGPLKTVCMQNHAEERDFSDSLC